LVHAMRNSIDHGIESAAERKTKQKPERGRISVRVAKLDGRVAIFVGDDGRGLLLGRLRAQLTRPDASDDEIAEQIFASGVSTAQEVSTISGRGVGLDAVRSFLRGHGGEARVAFTNESDDDQRAFELVLEVPEEESFLEGARGPSVFPAAARQPAAVGS